MIRRTLWCLALGAVAVVYFYRLDRPLLWGDEADTGIFARNVLRSGYPVAYDERNITFYDNGAQLNRTLVSQRIPWVQYYLGALSILVFGNNTAGLRILFAAAGVLSFVPIYFVLKPRVAFPGFSTALALLAPQIVLLQRNARYYSILILLYSFLVWHVTASWKRPKLCWLLATIIFALFFHTHPLAAACAAISLVVFCLLFERESILVYLVTSCIGFLSWLVWYRLLGPPLGETATILPLFTSDFRTWFESFLRGIVAAFVDLDFVNCFPILLWIALAVALLWRGRTAAWELLKQPLPALVLLNIVIQAIAMAAVFGSETDLAFAILRYMPHLLVFSIVSCFVLLNSVLPDRRLYLCACLLAVAFNVLALSFWLKPASRDAPVSWIPPVYTEVFRPPSTAWDAVMTRLRETASASVAHEGVIFAMPPWIRDVLLFYVGDLYIVPPRLQEPSADCKQAIRDVLGGKFYLRLQNRPEWLIDFLGQIKTIPPDYQLVAEIPSIQRRPDDGNRPELTRHSFSQSAAVANVRIFHKLP